MYALLVWEGFSLCRFGFCDLRYYDTVQLFLKHYEHFLSTYILSQAFP